MCDAEKYAAWLNLPLLTHLVLDCLKLETTIQELLDGSLAQGMVGDDIVVAASMAGG